MNVIITGASSGLGASLVQHFAEKADTVIALARNTSKIDALRKNYPDSIHCFDCDISDAMQVKSVFGEIEQQFGVADVLINNAGIFRGGPFSEMDVESIDHVIDTNLKGYLYCTLQVAAGMKARRSGHIINISSVSGIHGIPNQAIYGASKHGVNGFSDVLSQEMKQYNVHVCSICPGGIDTPLWNEDNPYPLENHLTQPEEIVGLIDYMLSAGSQTIYKRIVLFPDNEWH